VWVVTAKDIMDVVGKQGKADAHAHGETSESQKKSWLIARKERTTIYSQKASFSPI
jgi:hypothetical protein